MGGGEGGGVEVCRRRIQGLEPEGVVGKNGRVSRVRPKRCRVWGSSLPLRVPPGPV